MKSVEIKYDLNTPTLHLGGKPCVPVLYASSDFPAGRSVTAQAERNIRAFAKMGINLVHCDTCLHVGWRKSTPFEMAPVLGEIRGVLHANPNAKILLRLHVNPPYWWLRDNPVETCIFRGLTSDNPGIDNGEQARLIQDDLAEHLRASFASQKWLDDATEKLIECCQRLSAAPEGKSIFGIQVAYGIFGEWHQFGVDVSRPMQDKFHSFLAQKYGTDKALQCAWNDSTVSVATAPFHPEDWQKGDLGSLRDPAKAQNVIDAQLCIQKTTIDALLHFAKVVKDNWNGDILTGAFYNYYLDSTSESAQIVGHLMEREAYDSPYIDFLCCPFPYFKNRDPMHAPLQRNLAESDRLNKVLRLTEMDQHPYGTENIPGGDPARMNESTAMLRRNVMFPLITGMGVWYYDHRLTSDELYFKHGWWEHPVMQKEAAKMQKIASKYALRPYKPVADVLFVCDTKSIFDCSAFTYEPSAVFDAFAKSGVMADYVYLSDLDKAEMSRYKAVVFTNAYALNDSDVVSIKALTKGKQRVWLYAPGIIKDGKLNVNNIGAACGMSVDVAEPYTTVKANNGTELKCEKLQPDPLFVITDKDAAPLAANERKECVAAVKGDDWLFAYPTLDPGLATQIVTAAGAHRYTTCGAPVVANGDLIMLCNTSGGKTVLTTKGGKKKTINARPKSTYLLDARTGKILLK